ncbi:MAG: hypothetical protein ACK4IX_01690 [Candidatus Sericytochromatia bacterium]
MLKQKILPILVIFPLVLASCIQINLPGNNDNSGINVSSSPTSVTGDIEEDRINDSNIDSTPLIGVKPSSTSTPLSTPVPTSDSTATPKVEDTYTLYKSEVEVTLDSFTPDGIHGGEPAREAFYFKGAFSDLKLPPYDPLRGLEEVKDGSVVVSWSYDPNWNYKTSGGWTTLPSTVKDGDILPVEEYTTLHSRVGAFAFGNVNARVHFGASNYYYLVTNDGEYGKDPNTIWYNNSTGEGTKIGTTIRNKIDKKLNVKAYDEFAINISYSFHRGSVGWWYYYKK